MLPLPANPTILITGCSSGIGEVAALALKDEGWQVFATARRDEDIQRLQSQGLTCYYLDYKDEKSVDAVAEAVLGATNGRLYGLFNNGAYGLPGALEDISVAALRDQFEANVFGWHQLTRALLPAMISAGEGRIVQCSSILGFVTLKFRGAYAASKYALEGLSDTLRLELADTGVQVSLIEPGPIATRFNANAAASFLRLVNWKESRFHEDYAKRLDDPDISKQVNPYTLPSEACLPPLRHALMARHAKARYPVTRPALYLSVFKRLLPTTMLDRLLIKNSRP